MNLIRRYLRWLDGQHSLVQFFSLWTVIIFCTLVPVTVIVLLVRWAS